MDDLREQLHQVEANPLPDVWDDVLARTTRHQIEPRPSVKRRVLVGAMALLIAGVAFAISLPALRGYDSGTGVVPGSQVDAVQITISGTAGGAATMSSGETTVAGVPVDVIIDGRADGTVTHGPTYQGSIGDTLQMNSFHIDFASLASANLAPLSIAGDASITSDPADVVVLAFALPEGQTEAPVDWSLIGGGRMIPLQLPSTFQHLSFGPWRIVAVGRGSDGNLFQFAFEVDVQPTEQIGSDAAYWVNGARPTPQDGPQSSLSDCVQYSADRPDVHICGNVPDNYSPPPAPYHDDAMCRAGLTWLQTHQPAAVEKVDVDTCLVDESTNTVWDLSFPTDMGNIHVPFDPTGQDPLAAHE